MPKASVRLAAVVFTLLAALVTYLLWSTPEQTDLGSSLAPQGAATGLASGAKSAIEWGDAGASEGASEAAVGAPGERLLVSAPAELPADQASPGPAPSTRIIGRVVDPMGRPLEGARVLLGGDDPGPLDMASSSLGRRWEAMVGTDGSFELTGLPPGSYRYGGRMAGFAALDLTGLTVAAGEVTDLGDLVLQPGIVLDGHVVLEGGQAVAGARLFVEREGQVFFFGGDLAERPGAVTDSAGHFRLDQLAAGPWRVRVETETHPTKTFDGVVERAGTVETGLVLELERGARITGRVVGAPSEELARGLSVSAHPGSDPNLRVAGFDDLAETRTAEVGSDGSFVIEGCDDGAAYSLVLTEGRQGATPWLGRSVRRSLPLVVRGGDTGVELGWVGMTALEFDVVDAKTGAAIEDLRLAFGRGWRTSLRDASGQVREHFPAGHVRLEELAPDPAPEAFTVEVQALGYRTVARELPLAQGVTNQAGKLALEPASLLTFRVLGAKDRQPVEGAEVAVGLGASTDEGQSLTISEGRVVEGGGASLVHRGETDAEGVVHLSSIEGEVGLVTVKHPDFADFELAGLEMPVGVSLEEELLLPSGGEVLVQALDAAGEPLVGVEISERAAVAPQLEGPGEGSFSISSSRELTGDAGASRRTDASGEVRFEHLGPGAHEFRIERETAAGQVTFLAIGGEDGGEPWTRLEVAEGGVHELVLKRSPRASLSGRVTELGEALAGATLELVAEDDGDSLRIPGMPGPNSTKTDGAGRYELTGIKPGRYSLEITHPARSMPVRLGLDLAGGALRRDVDLDVTTVEGRVTGQDGQPLKGVRVTAERVNGTSRTGTVVMVATVSSDTGGASAMKFSSEPDPAVTDAEGRFVLRGVAPGEAFVVRAKSTGWIEAQSEELTLKPDQHETGVDLVLAVAGAIEVQLEGFSGMTLATATYLGDAPGVEDERQVVAGDAVTLGGLLPGPWRVSLQQLGPEQPESDPPAPKDVVVEAGETTPVGFSGF